MNNVGRDVNLQASFEDKKTQLISILNGIDNLAVALSGGVDSALLLAEAHNVLGSRWVAAAACSSDPIDQAKQAERLLVASGFAGFRVRHHGDVARIEMPLDQLPRLIDDPLRIEIVDQLRRNGFAHACADLEGYGTGSTNRTIDTARTTAADPPAGALPFKRP